MLRVLRRTCLHFLSAKGGAQGTIQRWAVLAEGEEYEWNYGDGAVLGGLVVCKLVSNHKPTATTTTTGGASSSATITHYYYCCYYYY